MRKLSPPLAAHLASGATTMCRCWRVTRRDGVALGFTDHDRDLIVDGTLFEAAAGFTASQIQSTLGLAVDNFTASGALSSARLSEKDILAGRYDDARLELLHVNWTDPTQFYVEARGNLGNIDRKGLAFTAEFRSLAHRMNQRVGLSFERSCSAALGDARCSVDLSSISYSAIATALDHDGARFIGATDLERFRRGWFDGGVLRLSGRKDVLIGGTGLIVNNLQSGLGRGAYFADGSGTSEGQFVAIYAWLRAAKALARLAPASAESWRKRALWMATALESAVYRQPVPADAATLFVPHWLYAARQPIEAQTVFLKYPATFTAGGAGRQFNIPADTLAFGNHVIKVYSAYDATSKLLWDNPTSPVVGTAFTILSAVTSPTGTLVTIAGTATVLGYVVFAIDKGGAIDVGAPYEAWPVWRPLAAGEVDGAGDSFRWALDMFAALYEATGNPKWEKGRAATAQTVQTAMAVDDGRAYFKPSRSNDPYSLAGTFVYNARSGVQWARDAETGMLVGAIPADAGASEAQIGRGFNDAIDASATIAVKAGSDRKTGAVSIYLDTASNYSAATRYYATLDFSGAGREALDALTLPLSAFRRTDGDGASLSALAFPVSIYACGFRDREPLAHYLFVESVRPLPQTALPYAPYLVPFTANALGGQIIEWRGSPGSGYQSPDLWRMIGGASEVAGATAQIQFLRDAQLAYQTARGILGPFAHCYVWNRADSIELGAPGSWVFTWYDPNSQWGGYQYRPLESLARYLFMTSGDAGHAAPRALAQTVLSDFLTWLDATAWASLAGAVAGPPTDFTGAAAPTHDYEEPHFAALILRTAVYALAANAAAALAPDIVTRATSLAARTWAYLDGKWRSSGALAGTWSPDGVSWFGFWNAEIVSTLSLLLLEGDAVRQALGISASRIVEQLAANEAWMASVTQDAPASFEIKSHLVAPDGSATFELWADPGVEIVAGDQFTVTAGCAKNFPTCKSKFDNAANFRGFPHLPSTDVLTSVASRGDPRNTGGSLMGNS
jgi:uncharacterized phage protein (TIGR02218 family)